MKRRELLAALSSGAGMLWLGGCGKKQEAEAIKPPVSAEVAAPLRVLVLTEAGETLGSGLAELWKAQLEADLTLVTMTRESLAKARRVSADVVIFPPCLLGELVTKGLVDPLGIELLESQPLNYRDFWQATRTHLCQFGGKTYAIPLGAPPLTLAYRRDVLDAASATVPTTWGELSEALQKLQAWQGEAEGRAALALPMANGWGAKTLLAWSAPYLADPDQSSPLFHSGTMEPLIDLPPYVRALEEMVVALRGAKPAADKAQMLTAQEAMAKVASGQAAMTITYPTLHLPKDHAAEGVPHLQYAMVPGSRERYDFFKKTFVAKGEGSKPFVPFLGSSGALVAISSSAGQLRVAERFLGWSSSENNLASLAQRSDEVGLVRESMKANAAKWLPAGTNAEGVTAYEQVLADVASAESVLGILRIPGVEEYLAKLDQAVQKAVTGMPVVDALAEAKRGFDEITTRLGKEEQIRALKRSLGQSVAS